MWISPDGRLNTVVIQTENFAGGRVLDERVAALAPTEVLALDELLLTIQFAIGDEIHAHAVDLEEEANFTGKVVPSAVLASVDWEALLGPSISDKLGEIDLRWRLDVVVILEHAVSEGLPG
jgi:hypothetical protein